MSSSKPVIEFGNREFVRSGVRGPGGDLGMRARVRPLGGTLIVDVGGVGSEFERRPTIADVPSLDIVFVNSGRFAYLDGSAWLTSDAPLLIAPSGLPRRVRFDGAWTMILARIPRAALLPFAPMLSDAVGVHAELAPLERAMRAFITEVAGSDERLAAGEAQALERSLLEMAGAIVRDRQGDQWVHGSPRAVVRDRALAAIAELRADQTLTPGQVAKHAGVSLRHLQGVLAEAGTSVAAEIRRERARVARSMLQDARHDALSINDVAAAAGFGSAVSMRRALEDLYGSTPSQLRNERASGA